MKHIHYLLFIIIILVSFCNPRSVCADVAIKIIIANPSETEEKSVPVHYNLPSGIQKEDIIGTEGMAVDYDVKNGSYFVAGEFKLGPKETKTLKVSVRDIWKVLDQDVKNLFPLIDDKVNAIKDDNDRAKAKILADGLRSKLDNILKQQADMADNIEKRIELYSINAKQVNEIKGEIFNIDKIAKYGQQSSSEKAASGTVSLVIEAENTLDIKAESQLKYFLPKEILQEDVTDAAGFEIRYDADAGLAYATKKENFEAKEKKRYVIQVRNVWIVKPEMLDAYTTEAKLLTEKLAGKEFEQIGKTLFSEMQANVAAILEEQKKAESVKDRISAYRGNQKRLKIIIDDLEKLRNLVNESKKEGTEIDKIKDELKKVDFFKALQELSQKVFKDKLKRVAVWRVLMVIIVFTSVLTGFFYFVWSGELKKDKERKLEKVDSKSTHTTTKESE